MSPHQRRWRGVLDHLDAGLRHLGELDSKLIETTDPNYIRQLRILAKNARAELEHARMMIERGDQVTIT